MSHYNVLIIGGGTAGITAASQLKRKNKSLSIAIIDPSEKHIYQPAWTLVGAGTFDYDKTVRKEGDYIPKGVTWIKEHADEFTPEGNSVKTSEGNTYNYDYMIVAPGIQIDLDGIEGLKESFGKNGVCSNYVDPNYTWEVLQNFRGGNAVFTQPTTPIKCGGAPQKIMYLAAHYFQKNGLGSKTETIFATPGSVIFGVKEFAKPLMNVIHRYGIHFRPFYAPVKIDGENKKVHFKSVTPDENGCVINEGNVIKETLVGDAEIVMPFDMLHLAPPQSAPDFIKKSSLSHQDGPSKGWLNVDHFSLQHNQHKNIFGLGDVIAVPTAKTGAAVRKQAPVVVQNILDLMNGKDIASNKKYEGYSSCPLVTAYGKMLLAEFKYDNIPDPSLPINTQKERYSMWLLKKYFLPYLYWEKMLKGKA